ncbi:beta-ketoacyl synthase [Clostridium butyricum]|uniref:beta-ketoacyl-[acyl-carrier-protein] synthase family protein n=1 Tax=Clostridium butyricum TaxID=1492 RepID=UPI001BAA91E9|nr:beta-ketoacyl-[acyl-carrier-protein] synthase family protein [Clostridium butyricum]MDU1005642.1 beta-ketoacyl-[acyl-carrier-protein] synthase family protein [Clostridium butyricum]QUF83682.1 beta-ketoacyl-[acyl-carrier-protein] synthase family protein [Clostridium butyricum]
MKKNRVVITGVGVVSPLGISTEEWWKNLLKGQSKVDYIDFGEISTIKAMGAEIKDFHFNKLFNEAERYEKYLDKGMKFGFVAADEAYKDSNLESARELISNDRFGVYIGTTTAGIVSAYNEGTEFIRTKDYKSVNPELIYSFPPAAWPALLANYFRADGILRSMGTSCYAGGESIGNCYRDIRDGYIDVAVAGGLDAPIIITNYLSFYLIGATSRWTGNPSEACRPFSRDRKGMVFGEGAAFFIIENLELALKRNAKIYAEVVGYAATTDGDHMVHPSETGSRWADAIKMAMNEAEISQDDVDYVSCHGTGTRANDRAETRAIKEALGKHSKEISIGGIKSMTGHAFGGATAIEVAQLVKSLETKVVPPTINYSEFDPECDLDCVPNEAKKLSKCDCVLKTAAGFGGSNMAMVLKKWEGR